VFWSGLWGVGGVEIPAGMALERVWQCDILKGKIQGGVSAWRQVWNTSICCKVCNRQEQERGLRNNDKDTGTGWKVC